MSWDYWMPNFAAMAELQARMIGVKLDPDDDRDAAKLLSDFFQNEVDEEDDDDDKFDDGLIDFFDEELNSPNSAQNHHSEFEAQSANKSAAPHAELTSGKDAPKDLFKTLFRRVAKAIHPDKEHDATKTGEKQELIKTLLAARKMGLFAARSSFAGIYQKRNTATLRHYKPHAKARIRVPPTL